MNNLRKLFLLSVLTLSLACSKTNENNTAEVILPSEESLMTNMINNSFATGDEDAIYFYNYDSEGVKLYKQQRSTKELTELDAIPVNGDTDIMYSSLAVNGDYLYYVPYDKTDSDKVSKIWRMKTDGSTKELISSRSISMYQIYNGKLYYTDATSGYIYTSEMDGTSEETLLASYASKIILHDNKVYYLCYTTVGGFHTQLVRINLDGTESEVIFDSSLNLTYLITDNGTLYTFDVKSSTNCSLYKIDSETLEPSLIIGNIPNSTMCSLGNDVYFAIYAANDYFETGLHKVNIAENTLTQIISTPAYYMFFTGDDEIIYTNINDQEYAGRFWQLYKTNTSGSYNYKLI